MMSALTVLGVWAVGASVAYHLDHEPGGIGRDRVIEAAAWPALLVILIFLLVAGGIGLLFRAFRPKG